jgi:LPXTG-motif cell wall-anchored protein
VSSSGASGAGPAIDATGNAPSAEDLLKLAAAMDAAKTTTTTTATAPDPATEVQGRSEARPATRQEAAPTLPDTGSGGGAVTLVGFVLALAALIGGGVYLRHRRRRTVP